MLVSKRKLKNAALDMNKVLKGAVGKVGAPWAEITEQDGKDTPALEKAHALSQPIWEILYVSTQRF